MRGGRSGRLHCKIITHKNSITITVPLAHVACFYTQQKYSFSKYSWFVLQIPIIRTTWPLANWDSCFPNNSTKNVEWTDARKAVPQVPSFASTQMVLVELSQTQDYKLTMMLSCACPLGNFSFTEDENKIQISGPFAETRSSLASLKALCTCCLLQRILGNQAFARTKGVGEGGGNVTNINIFFVRGTWSQQDVISKWTPISLKSTPVPSCSVANPTL